MAFVFTVVFILGGLFLITVGLIVLKILTDIHGAQRMNSSDLGAPLFFLVALQLTFVVSVHDIF